MQAEEEILAGLPLHRYKAVDKTFTTLENRKSRSNFLTDLQDTLDSLQLQFARIEEEIPAAKSKPTQKTKTKFVHKSLHEELRIMREAHPDSGAAPRQTFLNTSNRLWRKKVMPLLGFNPAKHEGTFGGSFKEQIYLSTLPECCFDLVIDVINSHDAGLLHQSNRKETTIKPGLFKHLVGVKSEVVVHRHLSQLNSGLINLPEFRQQTKDIKLQHQSQNSTPSGPTVRRLQNEILRLKSRVEELEELVERNQTPDQDVYEFDDTDLSLREQDMEVTIENEELDVIPDTPTGSQVRTIPETPSTSKATSSRKRNKEGELLNILDRLRERAEKTQEDDQTEEIHVFTKGEKVSAYYSNDKKWYDAVITAVLKDGYRIKYVLDGFREVIKDTALLKKM
ncbi:uncharacterized protein LOC127732776 isoform X1 [Mytilus californianus]|uniref:uncharacterized protein LOC127732776 isoform X1 n=2 Tax=Mytilus californianus TaxID=6549 RepID=UPI0022468D4C|nr:uncharacterized protein LOC127732776 isoform X1 [Mytilus californianus]